MGRTFDEVVRFENLHAAAWQVFRGKRARMGANRIFQNLEKHLFDLQDELKSGEYRTGAYRSFWIREPKPRLISAAPLRDRIVHHAVVQVIEPIFERRFIHHSYACRRGKGNHRAIEQFVKWARSRKHTLTLDVKKFFPSIDHAVLKAEIRRGIQDRALLGLLDTIIDGSNPQEPVDAWFEGDDLLTPLQRRHGLPIGNLTSQFLANVFMDRIDHLVKDRLRIRNYLRYVDDLAVFSDDPGELRAVRAEISQELGLMRLRLNEGKSRLRRVGEGLTFLGFVVTPTQLRLAQSAMRRARQRGRALTQGYAAGDLDLADARASWDAWRAHAAHGDCEGLVRAVGRQRVFQRGPGA